MEINDHGGINPIRGIEQWVGALACGATVLGERAAR